MFKQSRRDQLILLFDILIIVGAFFAVSFLVRYYSSELQRQTQQEVIRLHSQIASQNAVLIKEKLQSDQKLLASMANYISNESDELFDSSNMDNLRTQLNTSTFNMLAISKPEGTTISTSGIAYDFSKDSFFQTVLKGTSIVSDPMKFHDSQNDDVLISVPIFRNSEVIGVLSGRYKLEKLQALLTLDTFEGKGYGYIAKKNGKVIIYSNHLDADPDFNDIAKDFNDSTFLNGTSLNQVLEGIQKGKQGEIIYTWKNMDRDMNYVPIGINDWYLLSVIPAQVINNHSNAILQQTITIGGFIILIILLLLFFLWRFWHRSQAAYNKANKELNQLYSSIKCGIYRCTTDQDHIVQVANEGFYRYIGYTADEFAKLKHNKLSSIMDPDDFKRIWLKEKANDNDTISDEYRIRTKDGEIRWLLFTALRTQDSRKLPVLDCTFTDITPLKTVQEKLVMTQRRYDLIMNQVKEIIFEWNCHDQSLYVSEYFLATFGYEPPKGSFPQCMIDAGCILEADQSIFLNLFKKLDQASPYAKADIRFRCSDDTYLWCRVNVTYLFDEASESPCIIGMISDINDQKQETEKIAELAKHDPLTNLYNRRATRNQIEEYLKKDKGRGALFMLDVDDFKGINDQYGHDQGDAILLQTAQHITRLFRSSDVIGRFGGDEFIIFLKDIGVDYLIDQKANEIIRAFKELIRIPKTNHEVSCSIGISRYPEDAVTYSELFKKADRALYYGKSHGKNKYVIYNESDHKNTYINR